MLAGLIRSLVVATLTRLGSIIQRRTSCVSQGLLVLRCPGQTVCASAHVDKLLYLPGREINGCDLFASVAGDVCNLTVWAYENFLRSTRHFDESFNFHRLQIQHCNHSSCRLSD